MAQSLPFPNDPGRRPPLIPGDAQLPQSEQNLSIPAQLPSASLTASTSQPIEVLLLPKPIRPMVRLRRAPIVPSGPRHESIIDDVIFRFVHKIVGISCYGKVLAKLI